MYCLSSSFIYKFLRDWQTIFVAVPSLYLGWITWEIDSLMRAIEREKLVSKSTEPFPKEFFARRLSHLPTGLASKILVNATVRTTGGVVWDHFYKEFEMEHKSVRANRRNLLKSLWIR